MRVTYSERITLRGEKTIVQLRSGILKKNVYEYINFCIHPVFKMDIDNLNSWQCHVLWLVPCLQRALRNKCQLLR